MGGKVERTILSQNRQISELYKSVSNIKDDLIRKEYEVDLDYIDSFLEQAIHNGLSPVAQKGETVIGEIHAYTPNISAFQHILRDLTIAVHPKYQGKGIGRTMFSNLSSINILD